MAKPPRPARPEHKPQSSEQPLSARWRESLSHCGPYPAVFKRFFQVKTLTGLLEKAVRDRDRFLYDAIAERLGRPPVALVGDVIYEDAIRLVLLLQASSRARHKAEFRLTVAKNREECSAALRSEHQMLCRLHRRAPDAVLCPSHTGVVFLPDRHGRAAMGRELFASLAAEKDVGPPLYVASPAQLGPKGPEPRRFSLAETDRIKENFIALIACVYDEPRRVGIDIARLHAACFSLRPTPSGGHAPVLTACPRLHSGLRPSRLVAELLRGHWTEGKHLFPLAPAQPERFLAALAQGVSEETAHRWCAAFFQGQSPGTGASSSSSSHGPAREYLEDLRSLVMAQS